MSRRTHIVLLGLAVAAAGFAGLGALDEARRHAGPAQHADRPALAGASLGATDAPRDSPGTELSATGAPAPDLRGELIEAEHFLPIYLRLAADEESLSARDRFFLAFLLESCAFGERIPERALAQSQADATPSPGDGTRRAQARKRVAARNVVRLCEGIPVDEGTPARIAALYRRAADEGDPAALAWTVQDAIEAVGRPIDGTGLVAPAAPDAAQRQLLLAALESRDPIAIAFAGPLLTRGYGALGVAFGPDRVVPSVGLQRVMWDLVACDHGANCGPRRLQLDHACASAGRCTAGSFREYLQRYVLTPQDLADFARIAPHLDAGIRRGDWGGVHFLDSNPLGYIGAGRTRPSLGG